MNGFELFGPAHIVWLIICAVSIAAVVAVSGKKDSLFQLRLSWILAIAAIALHFLESGFRILEGSYGIDTLPLHLCALTSYMVIIHRLHPNRVTGELLFCPGTAAALSALIAPDWTGYAPFSVLSLAGFLSHLLIILYVLHAMRTGMITPSVRHWPIPVLYLAAYAAVMIPFDKYFHVNYGFLNGPSPGSVLVPMANLFGNGIGYYLGFAVLVLAGILASYGLLGLIRRFMISPDAP